jgi:hypothetical protein
MTAAAVGTREEWLHGLVHCLRQRFDDAGYPLPEHIRLACGWPRQSQGTTRHQNPLGATWGGAADGIFQVYISPTLVAPVAVGTILVHELVHTVAGIETKHGPRFQSVARSIGLEQPWSSTPPSQRLAQALEKLAGTLGPYPHVELVVVPPRRTEPSVRLTCRDCKYAVRVAAAMLDRGKPFCPAGHLLEP